MTEVEEQIVASLSELRDHFGLIGFKASFEDEGAGFDEVVRVREWCLRSGCELHLKISGAEAVRDLKDSATIGVDKLVAPLIESVFALQKFLNAVDTHCAHQSTLDLGINVESVMGIENLPSILEEASRAKNVSGVTVGRCDLAFSLGKDRSSIDSIEFAEQVGSVLTRIKAHRLKSFVGGAIARSSVPYLTRFIESSLLDYFETRYAIFDARKSNGRIAEAIELAHSLEVSILQSKCDFHQTKYAANKHRLSMITERRGN